MSVTHLPLSEDSRSRLYGHADVLLLDALDQFSNEFGAIRASVQSEAIDHCADLLRKGRFLMDACPIESEQGIQVRRLILTLAISITQVVARQTGF
jgi:hypothetical protein